MKATHLFSPDRLALAIALALGGPAHAAEFFVGAGSDPGASDPAALNCSVATNTTCTLSGAIRAANLAAGDDIITLKTNVNIVGVMKNLIDSNVTLQGDPLPVVPGTIYTINGNNLYRPLFVKSGTVTIKDLNLNNGRAQGGDGKYGGAGGGLGGALFVYSGNVTLANVGFSNNAAQGGHGNGTGWDGGGGMFGKSVPTLFVGEGGGGLFGNGFVANGGYGGTGAYGGSGGSAAVKSGGFGGGGYGGAAGVGAGGFGGGGGGSYKAISVVGGSGGYDGGLSIGQRDTLEDFLIPSGNKIVFITEGDKSARARLTENYFRNLGIDNCTFIKVPTGQNRWAATFDPDSRILVIEDEQGTQHYNAVLFDRYQEISDPEHGLNNEQRLSQRLGRYVDATTGTLTPSSIEDLARLIRATDQSFLSSLVSHIVNLRAQAAGYEDSADYLGANSGNFARIAPSSPELVARKISGVSPAAKAKFLAAGIDFDTVQVSPQSLMNLVQNDPRMVRGLLRRIPQIPRETAHVSAERTSTRPAAGQTTGSGYTPQTADP